ncbi:MAG: rRNA maturation RNase YbeY [Thermacetogeniaceae bacterium]
MQLLISNEQKEAAVGEEICSLIEDALKEVLAGEAGSPCRLAIGDREMEVSLALVDDVGMAALNRQYRGIAGTTDVLSFPMNICEVGSEQVPARAGAEVGKEGIGRLWASPRLKARLHVSSANAIKDPTSNLSPLTSQMEVLLGDIVISVPRALNQAAAYGNSFQQEMVFLAVHGMLHLLGYDDETDPGAARMMEIARQVMDKLGLGAVRDV